LLDFGDVALGHPAQRRDEIEHDVVGKRVKDELPLAPRSHDARAPHLLQVLRRVGDGKAGARRRHFDAALALRQLLQNFQPMRVSERLGDRRELGEQRRFRARP
jgi:hypothetical protein